jgi:SPW repeat
MMDYLLGLFLAAAPWLFHFNHGGAETWVPVVLGVGVILYSLLTDYELRVIRRIPMPSQLRLYLACGVLGRRHPAESPRRSNRMHRAARASGAHS